MKEKFRFMLIGFGLLLLSACATTQPGPAITGDPGKLIDQLEANLATARSNQVDVLAPGLFNDAQSSFMKAKEGLEKGVKLSAISGHVTKGNASLIKSRRACPGLQDNSR
jgi:OOP family OmpA-OmpF porin